MHFMLKALLLLLAPGSWLLLLSYCCEAEAWVVADAFDEA
jgi:hypothetical protein